MPLIIVSDSEDDTWEEEDEEDDIAPIVSIIKSDGVMDKWQDARGVDMGAAQMAARTLEKTRQHIGALVGCRRAALTHLKIST